MSIFKFLKGLFDFNVDADFQKDFDMTTKVIRKAKLKKLSNSTFGNSVEAQKLAGLVVPHSPDSRIISRIFSKFNYKAKCLSNIVDSSVKSDLLQQLYERASCSFGNLSNEEIYDLARFVLRQNYKKARLNLGISKFDREYKWDANNLAKY